MKNEVDDDAGIRLVTMMKLYLLHPDLPLLLLPLEPGPLGLGVEEGLLLLDHRRDRACTDRVRNQLPGQDKTPCDIHTHLTEIPSMENYIQGTV